MQKVLLTFHLIGVAMGLSVPIANIVLAIVAKSASPGDVAALMKVPHGEGLLRRLHSERRLHGAARPAAD